MVEGAHLAGVAPRAALNYEPAVDSVAPLSPEQRDISRVAGRYLAEGHGLDPCASEGEEQPGRGPGAGFPSTPAQAERVPTCADAKCCLCRWCGPTVENFFVRQKPAIYRRRRTLQPGKVEPKPPTTVQ